MVRRRLVVGVVVVVVGGGGSSLVVGRRDCGGEVVGEGCKGEGIEDRRIVEGGVEVEVDRVVAGRVVAGRDFDGVVGVMDFEWGCCCCSCLCGMLCRLVGLCCR